MEQKPLKILGICGNHRKEMNSWFALKQCMEGLKTLGIPMETEIVSLAGMRIEDCKGCHLCFTQAGNGNFCPPIHDDMDAVYPKLLEADGVIVSSPVHWWSSTSKMRKFIDRTNGFCGAGNTEYSAALYNKVGGVITVAYDIHGGTEVAATHLVTWMLTQNMIVVGTQGAHIAGTAATNLGIPTAGPDSVKNDFHGMKTVYEVGKRVAETAYLMKYGREFAPKVEPNITPKPGVVIDWEKFYEHENSFPKEHLTVEGKLATSEQAFRTFLETMSGRKKSGGSTWGKLGSVEDIEKMWLETKGMKMLSDEEIYTLCPEYYDYFLKK